MSKYWSIEEFKKVVKTAKTIREVLVHFGLPKNQGHYNRMFHKTVKEFNVDISHIVKSINERTFQKRIPLEELLVKGKFRNTSDLKRRLLKEGLLRNQCYECNMESMWNGKALALQLDHINGDNTDNRIENLRLLCPNCHSQTDTWSGRNTKKNHAYKHVCKQCGGPKKYTKSEVCVKCQAEANRGQTKIVWPAPEIILQMTEELGFAATGRALGVSDNAVRKFLRRSK